MKLKLKILTPVHIGSGEEISPLEYLIEKNKFIKLDMDGLFADKDFKPVLEKFIEFAKNQRYIGALLKKDLLLKHQLYSIDISASARNTNPISVRAFIKSAGRVFIPGSSLKGAILSAVLWKVAIKKQIKQINSDLIDLIGEFSNTPVKNQYARWLDVRDSNFKSPQEALEISLAHLVGTARGSSLPVLYETLKPGTIFDLEIKTSINSIERFGKFSEEEILSIVNEFYRKVYEKETQCNIKQNLPEVHDGSFLIRIGQGSTCLTTSFLLLAEQLGIKDYKVGRPRIRGREIPPILPGKTPRTRKLISQRIPFGWAVLKLPSASNNTTGE